MLERVFPGCIEDLPLGYFCVTVDLIAAKPVYHRHGPLAEAVGASMILPSFAPPLPSQGRLLIDGGLMDNLPTEVMASDGDGPIDAARDRGRRAAADALASSPDVAQWLAPA